MKQFICILFVSFVISCQDIQPVEVPSNLIEKAKMEEIIYEVSVVNGARGYGVQKLSKYGIKPETYIFEKYDIDSLQFAQSVSYYSTDIESYRDMYLTIQKRVDGEFAHYDSLAKIEKRVRDSIRTERAKELERVKDSVARVDSIAGIKRKPSLPLPSRVVQEIVIDSL